MKKYMRKNRTIISVLMIAVLFSSTLTAFASENDITERNLNMLPTEMSYDVTFGEIESSILDYIELSGLNIAYNSDEYRAFMYKILFSELEGLDNITSDYYAAYASHYLCVENMVNERNITINDVRQDNIIAEKKAQEEAERNPDVQSKAAVSYNVKAAQNYAADYAQSHNLSYPFYASDCANFASQVIHNGGFPITTQWDWDGKSKGRELAWTNWVAAYAFLSYWSLERGYIGPQCSTREAVNANANPGDCLAWKNRTTFEVYHIQFVQSKKSGNIYCSQHTDHYYNQKFNDRVSQAKMNQNWVFVIDFT